MNNRFFQQLLPTLKDILVHLGIADVIEDTGNLLSENDRYTLLKYSIAKSYIPGFNFLNLKLDDFYFNHFPKSKDNEWHFSAAIGVGNQQVLNYIYALACKSHQENEISKADLTFIGILCNQDSNLVLRKEDGDSIEKTTLARWYSYCYDYPDKWAKFNQLFGSINFLPTTKKIWLKRLMRNEDGSVNNFFDLQLIVPKLPRLTNEDYAELFHHYVRHSSKYVVIVEALLDHGMDPNLICYSAGASEAYTLLHTLGEIYRYEKNSSSGLVNLLIDRGANVNSLSANGETPLDVAYLSQDAFLCESLINRGGLRASELRLMHITSCQNT